MAGGKLSALKVRHLTTPGRYGDGDGLWFQVRDANRRSWLLRFMFNGKGRWMGLGPYPDISLGEAREEAAKGRRLVRQGTNPIEARRRERAKRRVAKVPQFRELAEDYLAAHEIAWSNPKHRYQWRQTLMEAADRFGDIPVAEIDTAAVLKVIEPIWRSKTETAGRMRGRIEQILDYAKVRGWRDGENPARWRGHLSKLLPPPNKITRVVHHPALPWQHIGTFMAELQAIDAVAAFALRWTILTAARTGEAIGARMSEIDLERAVWIIPAPRMKARREHRVPLSAGALAVLDAVRPLQQGDGWLFPGSRKGAPLSNMAMNMLLRRMKRPDLSVHGFRSCFRDWCAEATNYPREIAEAALAHLLTDKTEAAYQRGDMLERRRRLMEEWWNFCSRPVAIGDVVPIRAVSASDVR